MNEISLRSLQVLLISTIFTEASSVRCFSQYKSLCSGSSYRVFRYDKILSDFYLCCIESSEKPELFGIDSLISGTDSIIGSIETMVLDCYLTEADNTICLNNQGFIVNTKSSLKTKFKHVSYMSHVLSNGTLIEEDIWKWTYNIPTVIIYGFRERIPDVKVVEFNVLNYTVCLESICYNDEDFVSNKNMSGFISFITKRQVVQHNVNWKRVSIISMCTILNIIVFKYMMSYYLINSFRCLNGCIVVKGYPHSCSDSFQKYLNSYLFSSKLKRTFIFITLISIINLIGVASADCKNHCQHEYLQLNEYGINMAYNNIRHYYDYKIESLIIGTNKKYYRPTYKNHKNALNDWLCWQNYTSKSYGCLEFDYSKMVFNIDNTISKRTEGRYCLNIRNDKIVCLEPNENYEDSFVKCEISYKRVQPIDYERRSVMFNEGRFYETDSYHDDERSIKQPINQYLDFNEKYMSILYKRPTDFNKGQLIRNLYLQTELENGDSLKFTVSSFNTPKHFFKCENKDMDFYNKKLCKFNVKSFNDTKFGVYSQLIATECDDFFAYSKNGKMVISPCKNNIIPIFNTYDRYEICGWEVKHDLFITLSSDISRVCDCRGNLTFKEIKKEELILLDDKYDDEIYIIYIISTIIFVIIALIYTFFVPDIHKIIFMTENCYSKVIGVEEGRKEMQRILREELSFKNISKRSQRKRQKTNRSEEVYKNTVIEMKQMRDNNAFREEHYYSEPTEINPEKLERILKDASMKEVELN